MRSYSTVADLKRLLASLPDDMPLVHNDEWGVFPIQAGCVAKVKEIVEFRAPDGTCELDLSEFNRGDGDGYVVVRRLQALMF